MKDVDTAEGEVYRHFLSAERGERLLGGSNLSVERVSLFSFRQAR